MPLSKSFTASLRGLSERRIEERLLALELAGQQPDARTGETMEEERARAEASFIDFVKLMFPVLEPGRAFKGGWAVEAVCAHLEAVARGQIKSLLINCPPGFGKSALVDVYFPAWIWGPRHRPESRFLSASYSDYITIRNNRNCRNLMLSEKYRAYWGNVFAFAGDQNAKKRFDNDHRGYKVATHVGGATGDRGDFNICDDPHNVDEAESETVRKTALTWYAETWSTRTFGDSTAFVTVGQRVHGHDVSQMIQESGLGYDVLKLPMEFEERLRCRTSIGFVDPRTQERELLMPERVGPDALTKLKARLSARGGDYAIRCQLQQDPIGREGGIFKIDKVVKVTAATTNHAVRVRGWDFAASEGRKSPYTVGVKIAVTLGNPRLVFIEDVERFQGDPHTVRQKLRAKAESDGRQCWQSIPQDPGQAGKSQVTELTSLLSGYLIHSSPESGDKVTRAQMIAAQANAGNVRVVDAPWTEAFLSELALFPDSFWKDQVDALSRAYARALELATVPVGISAPIRVT